MQKTVIVIVIVVIVLLLALICVRCCKKVVTGGYNHFIVIDKDSQRVLDNFLKILEDCDEADMRIFHSDNRPVMRWNEDGPKYILRGIERFVREMNKFATLPREFLESEYFSSDAKEEARMKAVLKGIVSGKRYYDLFESLVETALNSSEKEANEVKDFVTFVYWNEVVSPGLNCFHFHRLKPYSYKMSFEERLENALKENRKEAYGVAITFRNINNLLDASKEILKNAKRDAGTYDTLYGGYASVILKHAGDLMEFREMYEKYFGEDAYFERLKKLQKLFDECYSITDYMKSMLKENSNMTMEEYLQKVGKMIDKRLDYACEDMKRYAYWEWTELPDVVCNYLKNDDDFKEYWTELDRYKNPPVKPVRKVLSDRTNCDDDPTLELAPGLRHFNAGWIKHGTPGNPIDSKVEVSVITDSEFDVLLDMLGDAVPGSIMMRFNDELITPFTKKELNGKDYLVSTPKSIFAYRGIGEIERNLDLELEIDPAAKHRYKFKLVTFGYDFIVAENRLGRASGYGLYVTLDPKVATNYSDHLVYVFEIQYRRYHYLFIDRELDEASARYLTNDYSPEGLVFPTDRAIDMWLCCEYAKNDNLTLSVELRRYMINGLGIQSDPAVEDHVNTVMTAIGYDENDFQTPYVWNSKTVNDQLSYRDEFFRQLRSEHAIMDHIASIREKLVRECPSLAAMFDGPRTHAYDFYPPDHLVVRPYEHLITASMQKMNVDTVVSYIHGNGRLGWKELASKLIGRAFPYELVLVDGEGVRPRYAIANRHFLAQI